jgi:hypothetical protein
MYRITIRQYKGTMHATTWVPLENAMLARDGSGERLDCVSQFTENLQASKSADTD